MPAKRSRDYVPGAEYNMTASQYRRTKAPRGLVKPEAAEAYRLRRAGATVASLAEAYGVTKDTITSWCAAAREEMWGR